MGTPSTTINFAALETFADDERSEMDIDEMHDWFNKLAEYDPEPGLTEKQLHTLFRAMKVLANYSFTAAEELKDVAEKEAIIAAERETALQEELTASKEEVDELRERFTVGAEGSGKGESTDTLRAQVSALKDENYRLQQTNRDRDRELADSRDRFENVLSRADALHRERDNLLYNKAQLEETIGELNRRLKAKVEGGEHEWEMKKLRQRNDQAIQLTAQLNSVLSQNESLKDEVQRVSSALEDATRLIESTTLRYDDMSTRLLTATAIVGELEDARDALAGQLEEMKEAETARLAGDGDVQKVAVYEKTMNELRNSLVLREQELVELRGSVSAMASRLEWSEARVQVDDKKELHLEQLRQQLQNATKEAKSLLGYAPLGQDDYREGSDDNTVSRRALLQTQHSLAITHSQLENLRDQLQRSEYESEEKDKKLLEVTEEVLRLRDMKLGEAGKIVSDLRSQLFFRDAQITRLNHQCSMLHVELGRYARLEEEGKIDEGDRQIKAGQQKEKQKHPGTVEKKELDQTIEEDKKAAREEKEITQFTRPADASAKGESRGMKSVGISALPSTSSWEEQALFISNIYYESIQLIAELEEKDKRLYEAEEVITEGSKRLEECRIQLRLAYERIVEKEREQEFEDKDTPAEHMESLQAELEHHRIFVDSIRSGGTELERRAEEINRKMIGENLERLRLSRRNARMEKRLEIESKTTRHLRERALAQKSQAALDLARLQKQLDEAWSEEARLQRLLLDCVPRSHYASLHEKYIRVLRTSSDLLSQHGEDVRPVEAILPDIVPVGGNEVNTAEANEALRHQLEHTKRLLAIIEEQADFWRNESETVIRENTEMRRLLEMCENENDASAILVTIETHLLRTIREQASAVTEGATAIDQLRKTRTELRRLKGEWANERRHIIAVARLLHTTLQRSQTELLHGISVSQVEAFRDKIAELIERDDRSQQNLRKTEEAKVAAEESRRQAQALQQSLDMMKDARSGGEQTAAMQRAMHTLVAREMHLKEQLYVTQAEARESKDALRQLDKSVNSLDEERRMVLEKIGVMLEIREAVEETRQARRSNGFSNKNALINSGEPVVSTLREKAEIGTIEIITSDEENHSTDTDSDIDEMRKPRVVVKTVVHDNTNKYIERLAQMKETAEICIRGYKDQLEQKEHALVELRQLLEKKMRDVRVVEKVEIKKEVVRERDPELAKRLEEAEKEVSRLEVEVKTLEKANGALFERTQYKRAAELLLNESWTQTEDRIASTEKDEVRGTPSLTPVLDRSQIDAADVNDRVELTNAEVELQRATTRLDYDRRTYQQTIAKLTRANKELTRACEEIKRAAMEEMRTRMTSRGDASRVHEEQLRAAHSEVESLRRTVERQRKNMEELRKDRNLEKQTIQQKHVHLETWHEKKRLEETIERLRKEVRESTTKLKTTESDNVRREKRISELEAIEQSRQRTISQLETQLRSIRRERSTASAEIIEASELRTKVKLLEEQLLAVRMELNDARLRISRLMDERRERKHSVDSDNGAMQVDRPSEGKFPARGDKTRPAVVPDQRITAANIADRKELTELRTKLSQASYITHNIHEIRPVQQKYTETREKLSKVEIEYRETVTTHKIVVERLEKEAMPISAIALLHDKLQAKELEIRNLKHRIGELEKQRM